MPSLLRYSILFASLTGLAACGGDEATPSADASVANDSSTAADSSTTPADGGTTEADGSTTPADGSTTEVDGGSEADAATDAAAATPFLTTALVVRTPFPSGTPTSALDCFATPPDANYLSSSTDGEGRRIISVRCTVIVNAQPWVVTFTTFGATSGFNSTDTGHCGGTPPSVVSSVNILGGGSAGSCAPDYATRVIIDSVDYDARTVSGTVDITLRSAPSGGSTFNINGSFSGAWAAPTSL